MGEYVSRNRYSQKVDTNQAEIVRQLRQIPGVTVEVGHDDILVGRANVTRWYEIKRPEEVSSRTGRVRESAKKRSQKDLETSWRGHYKIVWSFEQILEDMGIA